MADFIPHYDTLFAENYTWISGGIEKQIGVNLSFFKRHNVVPKLSRYAVDLGAGFGFQSIPLALEGFSVTSIDLSGKLLSEIKTRSEGLKINTIVGDILKFDNYLEAEPEIIVCMGDTLTHLNGIGDVKNLFKKTHKALEKGGRLILQFRDLSFELKDESRFIPVKSDSDKNFACFLEYEKERVRINDILHYRTGGNWEMKTGWYYKLRISIDLASSFLKNLGYKISYQDLSGGMAVLIAEK